MAWRVPLKLCALVSCTSALYLGWLLSRPLGWCSRALGERLHFFFVRLWARLSCRILGVRVEVQGEAPRPPFFLVSNHLSYLDVIVLMSALDGFFLSKAEVARWPFIGFLARSTGTLFIDRERKSALPAVIEKVQGVLGRGRGVVVFPEGTSTRGLEPPRFKPSLFEVAVRARAPVALASLQYATEDAHKPADMHVCWWGDMPFGSHFLGLAALPGIRARVHFGAERLSAPDRKALAQSAQAGVRTLFEPSQSAAEGPAEASAQDAPAGAGEPRG